MQGRIHYETYCRNCHGEDGRGVVAGAPDFSRGQALMKPDAALASGLKSAKGGMPAFQGILREQQLLDVVAYLRTLQR
jgi:cytochrome c6